MDHVHGDASRCLLLCSPTSTRKLEPYNLLQQQKLDGTYCNSLIHYETAAFDKIYCNNQLAMKCNALSLLKSIAIATNAYAPAVPKSSL